MKVVVLEGILIPIQRRSSNTGDVVEVDSTAHRKIGISRVEVRIFSSPQRQESDVFKIEENPLASG